MWSISGNPKRRPVLRTSTERILCLLRAPQSSHSSQQWFPASFKTASVTPLLKKKGLDRDDIANYRSISNLPTISKIVERFFQSRLIAHVEQSSSFNRFQSAYRRGHSTETALLRMLNDVYHAADNKSQTLLIQLDLSAAFDTIDKSTLLRRLEKNIRHIRFGPPVDKIVPR